MDSEGRPGILQFAFTSGLASIFASTPTALILGSGLAASVVNGIIVAGMFGLAMGLIWRSVIDPLLPPEPPTALGVSIVGSWLAFVLVVAVKTAVFTGKYGGAFIWEWSQ